ncbi:FAD-binding oxidoreductase [Aureimonas sp. AU4]|uniref:FAD-binding oxidoreductase n=1 Tax=Aureimonas sp. AU4 TaxID=1638163 RepID=UPI000784B17A|nr:FAD-linked oxidase C-terminal domain-containing protein [Aureimonas sp. AU4]
MLRRISSQENTAALIERLRALLGDRCTTSLSEREHHGRGESYHPMRAPDAVCYPLSTEEVAGIVRLCAQYDVPVIAFGAGTSLEGHLSALHGGISIDMRRMDKVLAVHPQDLDATVQAGVTRKQLNAHLRDTGLFFAIDPGADATLGGMAATRASGTAAVRYGTMRENVVSLTVVLADGRIVKTANRARKSSAGYDLTRLFVGSEGTLGLITEVTVRLHGQPEAVRAAICTFPDVASAVRTAIETVQLGVPVGRMEFLDAAAIRAVNRHSGLSLAEAPTLFFEFAGSLAAIAGETETVAEIAGSHGAQGWSFADGAEERARLWHARHEFHYAMLALRPGATAWATDACVPVSALASCIEAACLEATDAPFPAAAVGHVGDGNFHMSYVIDVSDPAEVAHAEQLNAALVKRALEAGGTCTGEHGVGYGKARYLVAEHGAEAVDVMRLLKDALDPQNILNPGKVLPPAVEG